MTSNPCGCAEHERAETQRTQTQQSRAQAQRGQAQPTQAQRTQAQRTQAQRTQAQHTQAQHTRVRSAGQPGGSALSRRGLLGRAATVGAAGAVGGLTGLAGAGLSTQLAFGSPTYTGDVLVVLSLRGGFDGLSAVVPHGDPEYYKARPTIAVPKTQLWGGGPMFGLHPALAPLAPLWNSGSLAAVHAVGQPNPTRSHFAAMEEMERAAAGTSVRTGWLDRMLGATGATSPFNGVSLGGSLAPRVMAGPAPDLGLRSIDSFSLAGEGVKRPMAATLRALYQGAPPVLAGPAKVAGDALATAATLRATAYTPANGASYPATPLGNALRDVARLVKGKVGLMTACVDFGDWDMHEGLGTAVKGQQMYEHLGELARALAAFAADLGAAAMAGVTLLTSASSAGGSRRTVPRAPTTGTATPCCCWAAASRAAPCTAAGPVWHPRSSSPAISQRPPTTGP